MSRMSSLSWNATPMRSPNSVSASTISVGRARHGGAEVGRGRDQRAGLVGHDAEVVGQGVVAVARADGLADLALHEAGERAGLHADGVGAERRDDLRGVREQVVADEDRERVVPAGVGTLGAATHGRLVHDVVVVERGEMGELDGGAGRHDVGVGGSPNSAHTMTSIGRNRLPPALSRCAAASVMNCSSLSITWARCSSTRSTPRLTRSSSASSANATPRLVTRTPSDPVSARMHLRAAPGRAPVPARRRGPPWPGRPRR